MRVEKGSKNGGSQQVSGHDGQKYGKKINNNKNELRDGSVQVHFSKYELLKAMIADLYLSGDEKANGITLTGFEPSPRNYSALSL
ncbi:hypothetical protein [Hydrogenimonas sp. SS33]|uniref:hypothetical protein n=1 Tax=Hydrogenimonas leucolamina TaxID=2954236 RepID=UPI00336C03BB